jgi:TRAP-type C4-dicarboxylate transport system substrate-binding protein
MERERWISRVLGIAIFWVLLGLSMMSPGNLWAASASKPIELSFATHNPAKAGPIANSYIPWAEEIEKRSNGALKIKFYFSETLVKARDSYDAVKMGVADMTWFPFSMARGRFPLASVMELPFLSPDTFTGSHALMGLYKKFPEMRAEVKDVHLLSLWVTLPYELHTVAKPVRKLEDVKGMKISTQPGASPALECIAAVPVTTPVPEIYTILEKGVADGSSLAWGAFKAYKIYEVTKYHTNANLGGVAYCTIMNKAKWAGLPKDLQKVILDVTAERLPDSTCQAVTNEAKEGMDIVKERGQEIYDLPRDEMKRWVATAKPVWEKWAKEMDGKGKPGRAILDEAVKLVEKYKDYGKNYGKNK